MPFAAKPYNDLGGKGQWEKKDGRRNINNAVVAERFPVNIGKRHQR
jgi:hypothetical protein